MIKKMHSLTVKFIFMLCFLLLQMGAYDSLSVLVFILKERCFLQKLSGDVSAQAPADL